MTVTCYRKKLVSFVSEVIAGCEDEPAGDDPNEKLHYVIRHFQVPFSIISFKL